MTRKGLSDRYCTQKPNGEQGEPETLEGVTVSRMAELAEKINLHSMPHFRKTEYAKRLNSCYFADRQGKVVFIYEGIPYWSEFDLQPPTGPGLKHLYTRLTLAA